MAKDVRMRGFQHRAEVLEMLELLHSRIQPLPAEEVEIHSAAARVLAADVQSPVAVPGFRRAAMDGYALRAKETFGAGPYNPLELEVIGEVYPGQGFDGSVGPGQAVRIMTGAPVPPGADAVLMAEHAEAVTTGNRETVRLTDAITPERHVGQIGEDIAQGSVVLPAGRAIRPQDLGVMASIGCAAVRVYQRPSVAVLITGDELLPCGSKPVDYQIVDSNSVMLAALIQRDGGQAIIPPITPDGYDSVKQAVLSALESSADMVLLSGGSSVGKEDHAPQILAELGELPIHGVAVRPAGPAGVGFIQGKPVFLMPGNPVSCLCAYDLFAGPALRRLGGRIPSIQPPAALLSSAESTIEREPYPTVARPLAQKIASVVGRVDYVRVRIEENSVVPLATSGASILSSTTRADGFVLISGDSEGHATGDMVTVHLY